METRMSTLLLLKVLTYWLSDVVHETRCKSRKFCFIELHVKFTDANSEDKILITHKNVKDFLLEDY